MKNKLTGKANTEELMPYYDGFKGKVSKIDENKFLIKGVYEKIDANTIRITELPVGVWTDDYKKFLEGLVDNRRGKKSGHVKDFVEICTDKMVDISVTLHGGRLAQLENQEADHGCNALEKYLKLYTTNTRTNMNLFDETESLKLYKTAEEIIEHYYGVRYNLYIQRKGFLIKLIKRELVLLSNKAKYILEMLEGSIDLRRMKKVAIVDMLKEKGYDLLDNDDEYKYLIKMPMDSVSEENVERILKDKEGKEQELTVLEKTSIEQMWISELDNLEEIYQVYQKQRAASMLEKAPKKKLKKKKNTT